MKVSLLLLVVGVVLSTLLFVVMILWMLKSIGGAPTAEVKATIKGLGSTLGVSGTGLIGSFLAITILVLIAIYFLAKLIKP